MRKSDIEKLRGFYEQHRRELFAFALSIVRCSDAADAADAAVHNAFVGMLKRPQLPRDIRPFCFRCVRNAAIDRTRVRGREVGEDGLFEITAKPFRVRCGPNPTAGWASATTIPPRATFTSSCAPGSSKRENRPSPKIPKTCRSDARGGTSACPHRKAPISPPGRVEYSPSRPGG